MTEPTLNLLSSSSFCSKPERNKFWYFLLYLIHEKNQNIHYFFHCFRTFFHCDIGLFFIVLGCFFTGHFVPRDVLSRWMLSTGFLVPKIFCPWGCFVPLDVLSLGHFGQSRFVSGCFVPKDVMSQDVLSMYLKYIYSLYIYELYIVA
jgi:hypothetical protein